MFSIQRFKVKNFRAFRESAAVELKPLTVFAGANSSGKSSFIQGLLLLKQSLRTESFPRLRLAGRPELFVEFSRFEDAIFKYAPPERNQLGFEIRVTGLMERQTSEFFKGELPQPINDSNKSARFPITLDVDITFRYDEKWGAIVDCLDCQASSGFAIGPRLIVNKVPDGQDQINIVSAIGGWAKEWNLGLELTWSGIFPVGIVFAVLMDRLPKDTAPDTLARITNEVNAVLAPLAWLSQELNLYFHYLGPLRAKPQLVYRIDPNPPLKITAQDDSAYQRLWYAKDETVQLVAPGYEPSELPLIEALNRLLESLGIKHSISIVPEGTLGFQVRFQTIDGQESVSIPHVGFGVSQILPVLLICLETRPGDTIIVDHPEIHLHPDVQARMADYFIELADAGRRVIVETQSQYFIRRLVRRTAERKDLAEKINIQFVRPPRGTKGATTAPLEMNEKGDISNWPPDFFPEPDEDTGKTLAARFERGEQ